VTGVMLVEGSTMPSGYNAGSTADLYDNITAQVMDAEWYLGFKKPYQEMPHGSVLKLTLNNSDKRFSPEFVSGSNPLAGQVQVLRPVQVRSDDETTLRVHWSGWLESVKPTTNQYGERTAMLKASGPERLFANEETTIEIQENKRTDEIIERLLQEVQIPPALEMTTLIGVTGYNEIGSNAWLTDDLVISRNLQTGKTILAFAADNWVRRGAEGDQPDTFNIFRALKDTVAAERGRLYFDRTGQAIFWNRHNTVVNRTVAVTLDGAMHELAYEYAGEGEIANDITVTCHPRTISAGENELLWQLENPIELQPGEEREIGASFRDDSDNRIGGRYLKLANVSYKQGNSSVPGTLVIKEAGANRAILMLRHQGTRGKVTLESAEVRGQKITDFGRVDATAKSTESMALYGHREMTLNLRAVDDQAYGQGIADFELMRRQIPLGKVQSVTLHSHGKRGGNLHDQQLARTIGDRIAINETQTGHSDEYFIIGEEHKLSEQGTLLATTWFLESATRGDYFMIGEDAIGSEATLLPI
ncbi:MAG: hypothetical protein AAFV98_23825, partial [Chloroflexota bacterium]